MKLRLHKKSEAETEVHKKMEPKGRTRQEVKVKSGVPESKAE